MVPSICGYGDDVQAWRGLWILFAPIAGVSFAMAAQLPKRSARGAIAGIDIVARSAVTLLGAAACVELVLAIRKRPGDDATMPDARQNT